MLGFASVFQIQMLYPRPRPMSSPEPEKATDRGWQPANVCLAEWSLARLQDSWSQPPQPLHRPDYAPPYRPILSILNTHA